MDKEFLSFLGKQKYEIKKIRRKYSPDNNRKYLKIYDEYNNYIYDFGVFPKGTSDETIQVCVAYMILTYERGKNDMKKELKKVLGIEE
jgi:hypothetical protein